MTNTLTAVAASFLSVTFSPEIRTAYLSRGKVVEDRPIQANELRLEAKLGEDQRFGPSAIAQAELSGLDDFHSRYEVYVLTELDI